MTPAVTLLEKHKHAYELLSFSHDPQADNYGQEVVAKLSLDCESVFKTLVLKTANSDYVVAITTVNRTVDTKALAKLVGCKKVAMASASEVERITGYVLGGVSPFAQKKRLPTFVYQSAQHQSRIYVSAGKRGVELAIAPDVLAQLLPVKFGAF